MSRPVWRLLAVAVVLNATLALAWLLAISGLLQTGLARPIHNLAARTNDVRTAAPADGRSFGPPAWAWIAAAAWTVLSATAVVAVLVRAARLEGLSLWTAGSDAESDTNSTATLTADDNARPERPADGGPDRDGDRLAATLGSMAEGVIVVDTQQRIVLANQAAHALLRMHRTDVRGCRMSDVCDEPTVHETVRRAIETGQVQKAEFDLDGDSPRTLALRSVCLAGPTCEGVVTVVRDLTELRALEHLRSEFVANVSHELKTPLSAIKAYAETLRLGAVHDAEHNVEFVERIEEQAERLHRLILDLLNLARVESGRQSLEIAELPLGALVMPCVSQYSEAAEAKGICLMAEPSDEPVFVKADEEVLRTVLANLIDNAVKYTPEGGAITVRWRAADDRAVLEVSDTGIGIAQCDQSRVFERFYRVDKARSRALGGTGLGLSIVKHLTQALGGNVRLESSPGQGSTFSVQLPRVARK
ncbi:MAG: ATP-binding protein [Pirellulales bacterium]